MKKTVILPVTNDLTTDQRVNRVCHTLEKMGFDVLLVGRKRPDSLPLKPRTYRTRRMKLIFVKGPQFYAEYNIRLFFFLLFRKCQLLVSNDLDTLPGTWLAARIRRIPHVHDCHEYFRGMPELNNRPRTLRIWKWLEDLIFPRLKDVYAVNESIARIYQEEYKVQVTPVRNVPLLKQADPERKVEIPGIREGEKIILYQGAVNVDRGLEEAILSMKYLKTPAKLLIIGTGDVFNDLKNLIRKEQLDDKVIMTGSIPFEVLHPYTARASVGLSIEKDVSLNYHYCLPNKFLDYIQAHVPVLISPLPEMKNIVEKYRIGEMIRNHDPEHIAEKLDQMLTDTRKLEDYRSNTIPASLELCWENEESVLLRIFEKYV